MQPSCQKALTTNLKNSNNTVKPELMFQCKAMQDFHTFQAQAAAAASALLPPSSDSSPDAPSPNTSFLQKCKLATPTNTDMEKTRTLMSSPSCLICHVLITVNSKILIDLFWNYFAAKQQGVPPKMENSWQGSHTITTNDDMESGDDLEMDSECTKCMYITTNMSRLKPF